MGARNLILGIFLVAAPALAANAQDYPRYRAVGSTFVPLDSWIYPVFERLAAQGYVQTAMLGMKPWTRFECARLVDEAEENLRARVLADKGVEEQAAQAAEALAREFAYELDLLGGGPNRSARLESVYARVTSISGPPLTDGYHFGQTISSDFGRPNRRGTNAIVGGAVRAASGPFAVYVQAEYQHAPAAPALSDSMLDLIARLDRKPLDPGGPFPTINRVRVLDAYVAFNLHNWQISVGPQSLSWAVGAGESLTLSPNAQPIGMVRIARSVPYRMPFFFKLLGPTKTDMFVGRLRGHRLDPAPFIYGLKLSMRPTPNLEFGYGRTTILGGGDIPVTLGGFLRTFFGIKDFQNDREGDSRSSLDWSYRIPGLRNWLTFYGELYSDVNPIAWVHPSRAIYRPGIHLTQFPGLPKLNLSVEVANSEVPGRPHNNVNYWNFQYLDGYTNDGMLLGSSMVGRQGRSLLVKSSYQVSPQETFEFSYRHTSVDQEFIPEGGRWDDFAVRYLRRSNSGLYVRAAMQLEIIREYPAVFRERKNNVAAIIEFGFRPCEKSQ